MGLALFVLLMVAALRSVTKHWLAGWTRLQDDWVLLYQAATLGFNYVEFGFVRRGLGGTLIHWSGLSQIAGTVWFHVLSALGVSTLACLLLRRLRAPLTVKAAFSLILLSLVFFWGEDAGRTDIAVAALLVLATMNVAAGRPLIAAVCLGVALGFHESAFLFGLPLMLALVLAQRRQLTRSQRMRSAAAGAGLVVIGLAYLMIDRLPHADNATMTEAIRSRLPSHVMVDWAIYFATSGSRGVLASVCQNIEVNPNYALLVASGLIVIAVVIVTLCGADRRAWKLAALACLPGYLLLCIVANDLGRWSTLACFTAWLFALARPDVHDAARPALHAAPLVGALVFVLLTNQKGPLRATIAVYTPSPPIEAVAIKLGRPQTPDVGVALQHCDPRWRDVLAQRRSP